MVRAKFMCIQMSEMVGDYRMVKLAPVTSGSDENREFFKHTPSGVIELNIVNPAAAERFKVGKQYYIDFTPVE